MDKPVDLRVQKTRLALTNALLQLMSQKRYEDITVNELCEQAMVRRATFYKHFGDKEEFFSFMIREKIVKSIGALQWETKTPKEYCIGIMGCVLHLLEEYRLPVQLQLKSSMQATLKELIAEEIEWDILAYFKQEEKEGRLPPVKSVELLAKVFTGALMSVCAWYIEKKQPVSQSELVEELSRFIPRI